MVRAAKKAAAAKAADRSVRVTGEVVLNLLETVQPNGWNPNRMTELQIASTREGLLQHGWLAAFALLVWGTDERGKRRDLIIDGEHRWRIATELGFTEGPMVFLDGLTEKQAKELTIELDNKRGAFDRVALRELIGDIGVSDGLAFRLGFDDAAFKALMEPKDVLPPDDFRDVTIDAHTDYTCPKCGYEWSGQPSRKSEKPSA